MTFHHAERVVAAAAHHVENHPAIVFHLRDTSQKTDARDVRLVNVRSKKSHGEFRRARNDRLERNGVPSAKYMMIALDSKRRRPSSSSTAGIRPLGYLAKKFRRARGTFETGRVSTRSKTIPS